jgi:hypothetical protein
MTGLATWAGECGKGSSKCFSSKTGELDVATGILVNIVISASCQVLGNEDKAD